MLVYPINLNIERRRCAIVGGGLVAERKALSLLAAGAAVTIISPQVTGGLAKLAADGRICVYNREYHAGDVRGFFLVVCAADCKEVNHRAAAEAREDGALINVVDSPEECDFAVPSKISRGDLMITVSTGGKSPELARRLREELEAQYGEEYGAYLGFIAGVREHIKESLPKAQDRERFWRKALSREVLTLLGKGQIEEAEAVIKNAISSIRTQS